MSAWKDFVTASLLGTEQGGVAPAIPAMLEEALGPTDGLEPEARFLTRAGALALWRRAGWKPERADSAPLPAAPPDAAPLVSALSAAHLRAMLGGHGADVLPEWLGEAARRQRRLPPESLPALLDWARQNRARRPLVMAAGGARVPWLAAQNPEWNFAADDSPENWETGNRDQRLTILQGWRATNPPEALAQLEMVWSTEPADARATLLGALEHGLTDADIPFLERALDDRSKEVRQKAVDLLSRLPGSPLVARMLARAEGLLVWKRGGLLSRASLEVNLPSSPDPAGVRDGLDPKAFDEQKFGEKAALLTQILSAIPLRYWTDRFQQTSTELLQALKKSEFADVVATGWRLATERQKDAVWAVALLDGPVQPGPGMGCHHTLQKVLSDEQRTTRLLASLRGGILNGEYKYETWHPFTMQLSTYEGYYPQSLGRELLAAMRRVAADERQSTYHLWNAAKTLVLSIPPALLADAASDWPEGKTYLAPMIELLAFRHEVLTSLAQP